MDEDDDEDDHLPITTSQALHQLTWRIRKEFGELVRVSVRSKNSFILSALDGWIRRRRERRERRERRGGGEGRGSRREGGEREEEEGMRRRKETRMRRRRRIRT